MASWETTKLLMPSSGLYTVKKSSNARFAELLQVRNVPSATMDGPSVLFFCWVDAINGIKAMNTQNEKAKTVPRIGLVRAYLVGRWFLLLITIQIISRTVHTKQMISHGHARKSKNQ